MTEVQKIMELLNCDEKTALDVIECDKRIDKGEKLFELTPEQEKVAKKYRQGDRKETVYKLTKRERKPDNDKKALVEMLFDALRDNTNSISVVNAEREIAFSFFGNDYSVVLTKHRAKKGGG